MLLNTLPQGQFPAERLVLAIYSLRHGLDQKSQAALKTSDYVLKVSLFSNTKTTENPPE